VGRRGPTGDGAHAVGGGGQARARRRSEACGTVELRKKVEEKKNILGIFLFTVSV
jgi:hypothetical protein